MYHIVFCCISTCLITFEDFHFSLNEKKLFWYTLLVRTLSDFKSIVVLCCLIMVGVKFCAVSQDLSVCVCVCVCV